MSNKDFLNNGDYYIHLQKIKIGTLLNDEKAQINWQKQRILAAIMVESQHKQLLNASLNSTTIEALANILQISEQQVIEKIYKELDTRLKDSINLVKMQQLHTVVNKIDISDELKNAIDPQNVQSLSNVLKIIQQALKLLEQGPDSLGAILNQVIKERYTSFNAMGIRLMSLLENYKVKNNYTVIKQQSLNKALGYLRNFAYALIVGEFKSTGNVISAEGMSRLLLNNLTSTAIAEGLGFLNSAKALGVVHNKFITTVGTQQVKDQVNNTRVTGKTDVQLGGVSISSLVTDFGDSGANITIDIGISSKFYTGQQFKDLTSGSVPNVTISSGSGGSLKTALDTIFQTDWERYLAYNYMAHQQYQLEINDLIIKRQILRLFASAGREDFVQFMFINGEIVSIWEIILNAFKFENSLSQSIVKKQNTTQPFALHIEGRSKISSNNKEEPVSGKDDNNILAAWRRSKKVNNAISEATIQIEMHLANLARGAQLNT